MVTRDGGSRALMMVEFSCGNGRSLARIFSLRAPMSSLGPICYAAFVALSVTVLKSVNEVVTEPYMVRRCCM